MNLEWTNELPTQPGIYLKSNSEQGVWSFLEVFEAKDANNYCRRDHDKLKKLDPNTLFSDMNEIPIGEWTKSPTVWFIGPIPRPPRGINHLIPDLPILPKVIKT